MNNLQNIEAVAFSNYVKLSPLKIRKVLSQIKGCSYFDMVNILKFLPNKASPIILKVLNSAVCNLKNKYQVESSSIFLKEANVDCGPVIKGFRPRAQGRAFVIKKRMSHIIISF